MVAQYWTETTYTDEANYDIVNRTISDNIFDRYYRRVLKPFDEAKRLITEAELSPLGTEEERQNKLMIIELMEAYAYHNLINIFGDVPYSEALDIENITPVYDDAAGLYTSLLAKIDAAVAGFDVNEPSFGSADFVYAGHVDAWILFGNSLKLRIGICLADVNASAAQTAVEDAVDAGVFTSGADNALFAYQGSTPNTNPLHEDLVLSGRSDFVAANTIIDIMVALDDPRIDEYFTNMIDTSDNGVDDPVWIGGEYGYSNPFSGRAHVHDNIQAATFPGILLTYSEVQFYIAEAAERGWAVNQTAEDAYNAAVQASFDFWGSGDATAYLAGFANYTDYNSWQEAIGEQSWIAFYTRGLTAFTQYRRMDYPVMNVAEAPETGGPVPTRFTYPINEQTLNAVNYAAAAAAIGGDDLLTRLFWDIADPQ